MKILVLTKRQYMGKDLIEDRFGRFRELPLELAKLGHEVAGICLSYRTRAEGETVDRDSTSGARVAWRSLNLGKAVFPGLIRYFNQASKLIQKLRPDLVWTCSDSFHAIFGLRLAQGTKTPCIIDLYDNFEAYRGSRIPGVLPLFKRAVSRAEGVTCFSQLLCDHIARSYRPNGAISVVENGVRKDIFYPQDRAECRNHLGLPVNASIIGTAGALHQSRGISALFRGFELLAARDQNLHLAVAGPRGRRATVPSGQRIHDLGVLPFENVPLLINSLDVAVICYRDSEFGRYSFPQKAYELMACRVPLVAARVGSMKELLADHPECLFEPEVPESLAQAIRSQLVTQKILNINVPTWANQAQKLEAFFTKLRD